MTKQAQPNIHLMLRCHVEVNTKQEAKNLLCKFQTQIVDLVTIERFEVEQYWKAPQYYVITMSLQPKNSPQAAISRLMESGKDGWNIICEEPDWSAVWNQQNGAMFLVSEARWANIEFWYK